MFFLWILKCFLLFYLGIIVVIGGLEIVIGILIWIYITLQYAIKFFMVRYTKNLHHEARKRDHKIDASYREEEDDRGFPFNYT